MLSAARFLPSRFGSALLPTRTITSAASTVAKPRLNSFLCETKKKLIFAKKKKQKYSRQDSDAQPFPPPVTQLSEEEMAFKETGNI